MFRPTHPAWLFGAAMLSVVLAGVRAEGAPKSSTPHWVSRPVGTVTVNGSAAVSPSARISVTGEGTDIWSTADGFQFLYQPLSGNGQIVARLASLQNTDGWAKAGLMIRQSLAAGSVHASLVVTPANGVVLEQRTTFNQLTSRIGTPGAAPSWLRLARIGTSFTASISSDGTTWRSVGTATVSMTADVIVGLAVTSRSPSHLAAASFDHVGVGAVDRSQLAGPIAAWSFDDGGGSRARASIGGLDGAITGASWTTAGRHGSALSFNGADAFVTFDAVPLLNLTTGMTLEAWVYPTDLSTFRSVAVKEGATDLAYGLYASNASSRPESAINLGAGRLGDSGLSALPLHAWSHLAATFDGTTQRLFINGVEVSNIGATGTIAQTSGALRIGGNSMWGDWFSGTLDDIRLYDRALSSTEINADMGTAVPPPPADTEPPAIAVSSPVGGVTLSGAASVVADATDNVGISSVQFLLNGANLGAAVTTAPHTVLWNTQAGSNGTYTLTAVARDFAGNANVSSDVVVTVNNVGSGSSGTPVVNGRFVEFTSPDHLATQTDGQATVSSYSLEVWMPGSDTVSGQPYKTENLGKPASSTTQITVDEQTFFGSLPTGQEFVTTIRAIGPGGSARSSASNPFTMQ